MILNINSIVTITIEPGILATDSDELLEQSCTYFSTEMTPLCASVFDVRRLVGAYIEEIPDDIINQLILEYSICAQDLAECHIDEKWKRYANKWVALKVALTVIYNTEEFRGSSSDKVFKQLGDFSVSRTGNSGGGEGTNSGLGRLIDSLECDAYKVEYSIRHCKPPLMDCLGMEDPSARCWEPKLAVLTEKGKCDVNKPVVGREWISSHSEVPRGTNTLYLLGKKYKTNAGTRTNLSNRVSR